VDRQVGAAPHSAQGDRNPDCLAEAVGVGAGEHPAGRARVSAGIHGWSRRSCHLGECAAPRGALAGSRRRQRCAHPQRRSGADHWSDGFDDPAARGRDGSEDSHCEGVCAWHEPPRHHDSGGQQPSDGGGQACSSDQGLCPLRQQGLHARRAGAKAPALPALTA